MSKQDRKRTSPKSAKSGTKKDAQRGSSKPAEASSPAKSKGTQEDAGEKSEPKVAHQLLLGTLALVVILVIHAVYSGMHDDERTSLKMTAPDKETAALPALLKDRGLPLAELYKEMNGANLDKPRAYVELLSEGRHLASAWGAGGGLKEALGRAVEGAKVPAGQTPTVAMVVIPTDRKEVHGTNFDGHFSNVHRGIRGAFIESEGDEFRLSPTRTVATNLSITDELKSQAEKRGTTPRAWIDKSKAYSFAARTYYIPLAEGGKAVETLRGNQVIPVSAVTRKSTERFTELLTEWMFNNLHPGGRMTYLYAPASEREQNGNNMIRQWMGTVSMGRAAKLKNDPTLAARQTENIRYNLDHFYKTEGELGYIEYEGQAKLGAAALAMISLIESPERAAFAAQEAALMKLTLHLWQENGEFKTFYKPRGRSGNDNFYPGEALLSWAFLLEEKPDPALMDKAMKSYQYYKEWHLAHRNPAFIPWHTQAYYLMWKQNKDEGLKDWIFEMNDWLVDTMQANSRVAYDDTIGRFYAPSTRFGVPHASSTGVYIEGLIDAFALARSIGDKKHEEKYRRAIVYGLRSSMQLQFQDDIDMFYVTDKKRLRGGMRTTVYDSEIRVDNVQHVLMGVQKVLREFSAEDFRVTD